MPRRSSGASSGPGAQDVPRRLWYQRLPLVRHSPPLSPHQWKLLGVLGAANLIDSYDVAIMGLALPQIQQGLGIAEAEIGTVTALIRLGVMPALVLTVLADYVGRRRLVLLTVLGFTACTFLTAFSQDTEQFTALQFLARIFVAGEGMLAVVVIAEEFGARTRGWGIGMLAAMGTLGHGLAALVFAVVNQLPFGWRALYVIGVVPLLMIAWFRRSLGETRRFTEQKRRRTEGAGRLLDVLQPLRSLLRMYPGRLIALCAALLPVAFVLETAVIFVSKTLQEVHGYTPPQIALLFLTVGATAPIGNIIAGAMGDRFGRKRVLVLALLVNAAAIALFYNSSGLWIPPVWGLMLLTLTMILTIFAALGSELFPTSYRSTASGLRQIVATAGAALGLWMEGQLYAWTGSHGSAITWMLVVTPLAPLIVALLLPETANLELEEIAPEKR